MKHMTPEELNELLQSGATLNIIDVREPHELEMTGKIEGAVNKPLSLLEFTMNELDKTKEYIVVCRSGGRSQRACQFLESYGFHTINLEGGMLNWEYEIVF